MRHTVAELKAEIQKRAEGITFTGAAFTQPVESMRTLTLAVALVDALEREESPR